jgi:hypothetical protein
MATRPRPGNASGAPAARAAAAQASSLALAAPDKSGSQDCAAAMQSKHPRTTPRRCRSAQQRHPAEACARSSALQAPKCRCEDHNLERPEAFAALSASR